MQIKLLAGRGVHRGETGRHEMISALIQTWKETGETPRFYPHIHALPPLQLFIELRTIHCLYWETQTGNMRQSVNPKSQMP